MLSHKECPCYNQQVETIAKANREKLFTENSDEFLSGITAKDKLIPVVTVVVYWGTKTWDAPTKLKEMLLDVDEETNAKINDYECNLFSIIDKDELPKYRTELQELFALLRTRNSSEELHDLVTTNEAFKNIDRDTAVMMREFANIRLPRKNKEGEYNMCKAVLDLEKKNQELGADKALVTAIKNLMDNAKFTFEESCKSMGISASDMARYKKMINS